MTENAVCCGGCCVNQDWYKEQKDNHNVYFKQLPRLTDAEKEILLNLATAWNLFKDLPNNAIHNVTEYNDAIHRCQQIIALRVARRVDPEVWEQP